MAGAIWFDPQLQLTGDSTAASSPIPTTSKQQTLLLLDALVDLLKLELHGNL